MTKRWGQDHARQGDGQWIPITVLNFTGAYQGQRFVEEMACEWLDFTDLSGVNGFCDEIAQGEIERRLAGGFRKICFLDSGNFHYVAYILIRPIARPFSLVVLDHHTDMKPSTFGRLLSCGCWVRRALDDLPELQRVYLIGVEKELSGSVESKYRDRVSVIAEDEIANHEALLEKLASGMTGCVYLSVDKDVFSAQETATNWDQGTMRIKQLERFTAVLAKNCRILGADVCGECGGTDMELQLDCLKKRQNDEANRAIAGILTKAMQENT